MDWFRSLYTLWYALVLPILPILSISVIAHAHARQKFVLVARDIAALSREGREGASNR